MLRHGKRNSWGLVMAAGRQACMKGKMVVAYIDKVNKILNLLKIKTLNPNKFINLIFRITHFYISC